MSRQLTSGVLGRKGVVIEIGMEYQGGYVGYIFSEGDIGYVSGETHGIIIMDGIFDGYTWGPNGLVSGLLPDIGKGKDNTDIIINTFPDVHTAAKLCDDAIINGYNDWFCPSSQEILSIYNNLYADNITQWGNRLWISQMATSSISSFGRILYNTGSIANNARSDLRQIKACRYF